MREGGIDTTVVTDDFAFGLFFLQMGLGGTFDLRADRFLRGLPGGD